MLWAVALSRTTAARLTNSPRDSPTTIIVSPAWSWKLRVASLSRCAAHPRPLCSAALRRKPRGSPHFAFFQFCGLMEVQAGGRRAGENGHEFFESKNDIFRSAHVTPPVQLQAVHGCRDRNKRASGSECFANGDSAVGVQS